MTALLEKINQWIWGVPMLLLILGVGIYLTLRTGFVQLRLLPKALKHLVRTVTGKKKEVDGVSPFQALCTALAATVGTGNLAGVAGAIAIGGPGSIFWMWICGLLGMVTKFAEVVLAMRYRVKNEVGEFVGGPMYMIRQGMGKKWKWLAAAYAFFGVVAAFGVGNATQINTVIGSINGAITAFGGAETKIGNLLMGLGLTVFIGLILLGGAKRIGSVTEKLIPFASAAYLVLCAIVLVLRHSAILQAFAAILQGAFDPKAATGGMIGSVMCTLSVGARRGVFTNEAGMGTASIAHSSASVTNPVEQGLMGLIEVFLDTIVICTMTALVILCSGIPVTYGNDVGISLTAQAFDSVFGSWVHIFLTAALTCFAVATVLGWGIYGIRCAQYLFGAKAWKPFVWLQTATVMLGAVLKTSTVWTLAEITNGLMAIPNLIAVAYLSPELFRLLGKSYPCNKQKNVDISSTCAKITKTKWL